MSLHTVVVVYAYEQDPRGGHPDEISKKKSKTIARWIKRNSKWR